MNTEMIALIDSDGKKKLSIRKDKYELVCEFIFQTLLDNEKVTLTELLKNSEQTLGSHCNDDISWLILLVKRDLEARGLLKISCERNRIQVIELKKSAWRKLNMSGGFLKLKEGAESAKPLSGLKVWYLNY